MVKLPRMFPLLALIVGVVLPTLPAEGDTEITSGTATGIQRPGTTGVTILGRHDPGPANDVFSPCPPNATVLAVIGNGGVLGDDVFPFNDFLLLNLPLVSSARNTCIYEDLGPDLPPPASGRPRVKLSLGADGGGNTFSFRLQYRQGSYVDSVPPFPPTTPRFCPPPPPPVSPARVTLTTAFVLNGGAALPIRVEGTVDWLSFGEPLHEPCNFLKFP